VLSAFPANSKPGNHAPPPGKPPILRNYSKIIPPSSPLNPNNVIVKRKALCKYTFTHSTFAQQSRKENNNISTRGEIPRIETSPIRGIQEYI
jgi:hypothetical protein